MQSSWIESLVLVLIFDLVCHDELGVVDVLDYGLDLLAGWRDAVFFASRGDDIEKEVGQLLYS